MVLRGAVSKGRVWTGIVVCGRAGTGAVGRGGAWSTKLTSILLNGQKNVLPD